MDDCISGTSPQLHRLGVWFRGRAAKTTETKLPQTRYLSLSLFQCLLIITQGVLKCFCKERSSTYRCIWVYAQSKTNQIKLRFFLMEALCFQKWIIPQGNDKLHKCGRVQKNPKHVITVCSTYYFPHCVYRRAHLRPAAPASGTAFWVVFEHTSVSSVQKPFRSQKYLWIPFDIFAYTVYVVWNTHALFLLHPHLKQKSLD